jgi:hypothetical protein
VTAPSRLTSDGAECWSDRAAAAPHVAGAGARARFA